MKKNIINNKGFSFGWNNLNVKQTIKADGSFEMREWQEEAFAKLKFEAHIILNAPMGSGKSWLMCFLSAYKMKKDNSLRCIIAVPQTIIVNGFTETTLPLSKKEKIDWVPQHNLCNCPPDEGTNKAVINWLKRDCVSFNDKILLCTHATLVAVYKKLKESNQRNLLKNLLLWIDEAHHLQNASIEGLEEAVLSNGIGELVLYANNQKSIQIGLATATLSRGDRLDILTPKMRDKFVRFDLPYDKYLKSMKHLRSFSFDFLPCGKDYAKAIQKLAKSRKGKDIIYIPHPQSKHSTGDKYQEVETIIEKYQKVHSGNIVDTKNGLTLLQKKNSQFKILDLVDEDRRKEKKEFTNTINENKDNLDAIIAMNMFKEGANWIWADRSIIVGTRGSLTDVIQIIGRLFRDAKDKKHVEVVQLLPFSLDHSDEDELKENLNNYLKAIYASLLLEDVLNPVQIKMKGEKKAGKDGFVKSVDWLGELLDTSSQLSLKDDVTNSLLEIIDTNNKAGEVSVLWDEYQKILPDILKDYGIEDHIEEIGNQIWASFARRTLSLKGIDVADIDFDILQKTHPLEFLLAYTSGNCNIDTFKELRKRIGVVRKSVDEWVVIAEKLAEDNGGILPNYLWLRKNGYHGLTSCMFIHPEKFHHIKQLKSYVDLSEHQSTAEKLAKENGGILPSGKWLKNNGYSGLKKAIYKYPDQFRSFKQEKLQKSIKDHIKTAEKLAKENGGTLQCGNWLKTNGYSGLNFVMGKYPDEFKHIKQEKKRKKLDEQVLLADKLAKENGGILPNQAWLQNNCHSGLAHCIVKYPNSFKHIKQEYKGGIKIDEHIKLSKKLAKENGGILPATSWLKNNGYSKIVQAKQDHPEQFSIFKQEKLYKTIDEWVLVAIDLAKENGGILPCGNWLKKNGYGGLDSSMYQNPNKFKHIKRQ